MQTSTLCCVRLPLLYPYVVILYLADSHMTLLLDAVMTQVWLRLKIILGTMVGLIMAGIVMEHFVGPSFVVGGLPSLKGLHGVTAALFALAAAALLFVDVLPDQLPQGPFTAKQVLDGFLRFGAAIAAFLAGSFWLWDATKSAGGQPEAYLLTAGFLGCVMALSFSPYVFGLGWLFRRGRNP